MLLPLANEDQPMKGYQRSRRVNVAVHEGLIRCRQSDATLDTLASYMAELRDDKSWRGVDLELVESAVRQIVSQLVDVLAEGPR